jgi:hypothetical protein
MTTKRLKRPRDPIQFGKLIVDIATGQVRDEEHTDKDPTASECARQGGLKGGRARAEKLSPERRSEIAKHAARARYAQRHRSVGGES